MMRLLPLFSFVFIAMLAKAHCITVSPQDAQVIGNKIWKNEAAGSVELLTHWNKGEDFASLGIGHAIWYTAQRKDRFEEIFPQLLTFLQKEGAAFPEWLTVTTPCPWNSRDEFYENFQSPKMKSLRQFLVNTIDKQAVFMANRLESTLPQIVESMPTEQQRTTRNTFDKLAKTPNGLYALVDYLNFKGAGISSKERYNGQGWGLRQVLEKIPANTKDPVADFVVAAKELLARRIQNSPPERNEAKWKEGWFNRLDTYLQF